VETSDEEGSVWGREVWGEAPIPLIVRSSTNRANQAEAQRPERATTTKQQRKTPKVPLAPTKMSATEKKE